jgi:hypothetical protein
MSPPIEINAIHPAATVPAVGQAVGHLPATHPDASAQKEPKVAAPEPVKPKAEPVKTDTGMVHLGYTVDHAANALKIKVTNQESGEVVREFELKGLGSAHHDPVSAKGLVVDNKT